MDGDEEVVYFSEVCVGDTVEFLSLLFHVTSLVERRVGNLLGTHPPEGVLLNQRMAHRVD